MFFYIGSLRQKKQVEFVSGQLSSDYELVLRRPGTVMPNCSRKDYQRQLKSIEDGLLALPYVSDTTTGFGSDTDVDERALPLADGGKAKAKRGVNPVSAIADRPLQQSIPHRHQTQTVRRPLTIRMGQPLLMVT